VHAQQKNEEVLAEIMAQKEEQDEKKQLMEKNVALLREDVEMIRQKLKEEQRQKEKFQNVLTSLYLEEERVRKEAEEEIRRREQERMEKLAEARTIEDETEREREVARYSEPISRENFISESQLNQIEASFAREKGSLPWPVESSTISEHFGNRRHPVYGTITPNLGIEIVTNARQPVRTVHDGYVVDVLPITGYGDVVLVSHGKFITAYGNLSQVMVSKRDILRKGDMIGLSGDQDSPRGQSVFFMVRETNTNMDPEAWLTKK
jgi:septal ring factor EnvC (AmiA/AmiB activator)